MPAKKDSSPADTDKTIGNSVLSVDLAAAIKDPDSETQMAKATTGPRGDASDEPITSYQSVASDQGRHLLVLSQSPLRYVDVEYFGDPSILGRYDTKPVDGMPGELDVCVNGHWARCTIETGPQTVSVAVPEPERAS